MRMPAKSTISVSEAVLEERWDRPSPNRLRVRLKLTDPSTYTAPWESSVKVWALIPKEIMAIGGWSGILEDRCVPSDESLFNQFRDRAAYSFACENSIYIRADCVGQGVGAALLRALVDAATAYGFRQMIAVVGGGEPASVALHTKLGFKPAGRMRSVGRKFGRWLDTVYMQLELGEGDRVPPDKEPG